MKFNAKQIASYIELLMTYYFRINNTNNIFMIYVNIPISTHQMVHNYVNVNMLIGYSSRNIPNFRKCVYF